MRFLCDNALPMCHIRRQRWRFCRQSPENTQNHQAKNCHTPRFVQLVQLEFELQMANAGHLDANVHQGDDEASAQPMQKLCRAAIIETHLVRRSQAVATTRLYSAWTPMVPARAVRRPSARARWRPCRA